MAHHHGVPLETDRARRLAQKLVEQVVGKAGTVELEMLEVLDIHQPARPVVLEDQSVLVHDHATRGPLRWREAVPDHLEHVVVAGHGEDDHHQPLGPGSELEPLLGGAEVAQQVTVELGLSVLVVPDGDVELGDPLPRHQPPQEADQVVGPRDVDMEVRPGEAEHDRSLVLGQQHGVHEDPFVAITQCDDQGDVVRARIEQADDVRRLPPIEHRAHQFRLPHRRQCPGLVETSVDAIRHRFDICLETGVGHRVGESLEDPPDQVDRARLTTERDEHRLL